MTEVDLSATADDALRVDAAGRRRCRRRRTRAAIAFDVAVARSTAQPAPAAGDGAIISPMPGKIIALEVAAGEAVTKGQKLLTLEAMKMEHSLVAPFDGVVAELNAEAGAQVSEGALLARIEKGEGSDHDPFLPSGGGTARALRGARARARLLASPRSRRFSSPHGEELDARPLLRAMDAGRHDPAPAAPDGDRDRQSADLDADPQSAAAPSRRDLCRKRPSSGGSSSTATFTFALLVGLSVGDTTLGHAGRQSRLRQGADAEAGVHRRHVARRDRGGGRSRTAHSRPEAGIVTFEHRMFNQRDELVCVMERTALMKRSDG